jgi:fructose-1,6-bisphosphatase/sedoheptulose 1,7-bisphosphatase-like protein
MGLKSRLKELKPLHKSYRVRAWNDEEVFLRGLTIAEYNEQKELLAATGVSNEAVFAACVVKCLAEDEDGTPVFEDVEDLDHLPLDGLFECFQEIMSRSSRAAHVEAAKGN